MLGFVSQAQQKNEEAVAEGGAPILDDQVLLRAMVLEVQAGWHKSVPAVLGNRREELQQVLQEQDSLRWKGTARLCRSIENAKSL